MDRRTFMGRSAALAAAIGISTVPIIGCSSDDGAATNGGGGNGGNGGTSGDGDNGTKTGSGRLSLSAFPISVSSSYMILGQQEGIFEDAGWTIEEVLAGAGGGTSVRDVVTGGVRWGIAGAAAVLQAKMSGAAITILTETDRAPTEAVWLSRADRDDLNSMEDIAGKRIGITNRGSSSEAALLLVLDNLGVEAEIVATGGMGEGLALLDRGDLDLAFALDQLFESSPGDNKRVFRASDAVPRMTWGLMFISSDFADSEPELVQAFVDARSECVNRTIDDLETTAAVWAEEAELAPEACTVSLEALRDADGFVTASYDPDSLETLVRSMAMQGLASDVEGFPYSELLDQSFIAEEDRVEFPS